MDNDGWDVRWHQMEDFRGGSSKDKYSSHLYQNGQLSMMSHTDPKACLILSIPLPSGIMLGWIKVTPPVAASFGLLSVSDTFIVRPFSECILKQASTIFQFSFSKRFSRQTEEVQFLAFPMLGVFVVVVVSAFFGLNCMRNGEARSPLKTWKA